MGSSSPTPVADTVEPTEEIITPKEEEELSESSQESAPVRPRKHRVSASKYVPIFPRASFARLVREIAKDMNKKHNFLWTPEAMLTIQEAVEMHLHQRFHVCDGLLRLCRKKTISKDIFEFLDLILEQCGKV